MALKKDGDRVRVTYTIKKDNVKKLERLAEETNRPLGRMLDEILEKYQA